MRIAIQPENIEENSYALKWTMFLKAKGIDVKWVDLATIDPFEQLKDCDAVMWRWTHGPSDKIKAYKILHAIEYYLGIPVYPNHATCWHYDDKVAQYYLLKSIGAPIPNTWIFWNKQNALKWANETMYPKVFKLSSGAGSSNVIKVNSKYEAQKLIFQMFNQGIFPMTMNEYRHRQRLLPRNKKEIGELLSRIKQSFKYVLNGKYPPLPTHWWLPEKQYIYFQEYLPNNEYDTRIVIIGNRARGFRRFNRPGDFRASGSGKFDVGPSKINLESVKIAFEISKKLNFQCMAYDFLFKNGLPVIGEISYTFPDKPYGPKLPGYWDSDLNWVPKKMWPQEAQVEDFLEYITDFKTRQK